MVLLHGYGSSAEQWAPFTQTIRLPPGGRFVFPQAPGLTSPPDGPPGGRGWWRLELASHIPSGRSVPDLSATQPPGLKAAASLVQELLETHRAISRRTDRAGRILAGRDGGERGGIPD